MFFHCNIGPFNPDEPKFVTDYRRELVRNLAVLRHWRASDYENGLHEVFNPHDYQEEGNDNN